MSLKIAMGHNKDALRQLTRWGWHAVSFHGVMWRKWSIGVTKWERETL